jgi:hypothetical protein
MLVSKKKMLLRNSIIALLLLSGILSVLMNTYFSRSLIPATGEQRCPLLPGFSFGSQQAERLPALSSSAEYCWALIGNQPDKLDQEYNAGIRYKTFSLSWKRLVPSEGVPDKNYIARKQEELRQLYQRGFGVILILGYHDIPAWIHDQYEDSHYINQYGDIYVNQDDAGDANLVFNPALRNLTAEYIQSVFAQFGTQFVAVRVGGGRYGELTYPPAVYQGRSNCYWAFDRNAKAKSPVQGWRPGDASPNGEAETFLTYYLDTLADFQNWQIEVVRKNYAGPIMVLYPSWGMRPGNFEAAVKVNLNGATPAEKNGEVQRGFDFARQITAIKDPNVIITTTWLDADGSADFGTDLRFWSPVKYLAYLANKHPLDLLLYGENTGHGSPADLEFTVAQMKRYGLIGMAWYNETELFSGQYASLHDYRRMILVNNSGFKIWVPLLHSKR